MVVNKFGLIHTGSVIGSPILFKGVEKSEYNGEVQLKAEEALVDADAA